MKNKEKHAILRENIKLGLKRMYLIRTFEDKENLRHFYFLHLFQEAVDVLYQNRKTHQERRKHRIQETELFQGGMFQLTVMGGPRVEAL